MRIARAVWVIGVWSVLAIQPGCRSGSADDETPSCYDEMCEMIAEPCAFADEDLARCAPISGTAECFDRDRDGFVAGADCDVELPDCDDTDPTIGPGYEEICDVDGDGNPIDNDCDGRFDEDNELSDATTSVLQTRRCPRQVGICIGAEVECSGGIFRTCEAGVGYPVEYEEVEVSCDCIDNNCDNQIDENCCGGPCGWSDPAPSCVCQPGSVWECGSATGACTRGVQVCEQTGVDDDGHPVFQVSDCIEADLGDSCVENGDCTERPNGFCVQERLTNNEDLFDVCDSSNPGACSRSVCRYLTGTVACDQDEDCGDDEVCVAHCFDDGTCAEGRCQPRNVTPLTTGEICNGLDDNCDGRIDDDGSRLSICGPCPFNMVLVDLVLPSGASEEICVDQYEATRPDATLGDAGTFEYHAVAQPGVLPWSGISGDDAQAACQATAYADLFDGAFAQPIPRKRLCLTFEFEQACGGPPDPEGSGDYPYGAEPVAGVCWDGTTGEVEPQPTGIRATCCRAVRDDSPQGAQSTCDMGGNVAEWVQGLGGEHFLAGGSFADGDPVPGACGAFVAAGDVAQPFGPEVGFRCCTLRAR